jgi:predicted membrane protein
LRKFVHAIAGTVLGFIYALAAAVLSTIIACGASSDPTCAAAGPHLAVMTAPFTMLMGAYLAVLAAPREARPSFIRLLG